jgi:hypothetical protein
VEELSGCLVLLRLQTWHRVYLPGEAPQPHGVLLCVRSLDIAKWRDAGPIVLPFEMRLRSLAEARGEVRIDVGGRMVLDLCATR